MTLGRIVIVNGAPRAGKSSIAAALQTRLPGTWMNFGVDAQMRMTPEHLQPGIGLRPGGEKPELEPVIKKLYAALYESIAAHSREGLDVVADLGHHGSYSKPLGILADCTRRLTGLPVLFVGARCPIETIMERRRADPQGYVAGEGVPGPVQRWQDAVHQPGICDLEVDTSVMTPEACAEAIARALEAPPSPSAFQRIANNSR